MFSIILIWSVIVVLVFFSFNILRLIKRMVLEPLSRIFTAVQLAVGDVLTAAKTINAEDDQMDMDVLETAISKLSKLGEHVTAASKGHSHKMQKVLNNKDIDDDTKKWLQSQYTTEGIHEQRGGLSEADRRRSVEDQVSSNRNETAMARRNSTTQQYITSSGTHLMHDADHDTFAFKMDSFEFNVWDCKSTQELFQVAHWAMVSSHCVADFHLDDTVLRSFISAVEVAYNDDNPYHNFHHAVDTMQTLNQIMRLTKMNETMLTQTDIFAALIAALGHDTGHPGVSSQFLITTRDELAMT